MKIHNLYKVELYRFFRSISFFLCISIVYLVILLLASDEPDVLLSDGSSFGVVKATMNIADLVLVLVVSMALSDYVGREFKHHTIKYEIMQGYDLWKVCFVKTMTCGIFLPAMFMITTLIFLTTFAGAWKLYTFLHIIFMFIILFHICSCTTLYILLCRNGILGGCAAFVRFTLLEVVIIFVMQIFVPEEVLNVCKTFFVMSQWSAVNSSNVMILNESMVGIVVGTLVEYGILLAVIRYGSKKVDF